MKKLKKMQDIRAMNPSSVWRRRADLNRCIKVLQTSPLATWVRRRFIAVSYEQRA